MKSVRPFSGIPDPQQAQKKGRPPFCQDMGKVFWFCLWTRRAGISLLTGWWVVFPIHVVLGSHGSHETHSEERHMESLGEGYSIPGAPFKIYLSKRHVTPKEESLTEAQEAAVIQTLLDAFTSMTQYRKQYQRYDEALTKNVLQKVIIEPRVFNREGKEFSFLVARTKEPGKVNLLISASALNEKGYINQPEALTPALAREFQWVVIKSDTKPKRKMAFPKRDLKNARIKTNKEIRDMTEDEREQVLQDLFQTYLTTVDDYRSLDGQPGYEVGGTKLMPPAQRDSTTKLYDIRVRHALQLIVRDRHFQQHTPKAVTSLLNGKIWNVSFAKIDERDWATRTRVLPKEKSVTVGNNRRTVQPAKILVNLHRKAAPEDPFYSVAEGLPMGALSPDQLARVIALEIQQNITDKSMRGHVAQDELTAPK